ncbi:MAG TPA: hypothetical protein PLN69_08275 [bacterium]|nr:hypothetical protein [bacterium]
MREEKIRLKRSIARTIVLGIAVFLAGSVVIRLMYADQKAQIVDQYTHQQGILAWSASAACGERLRGVVQQLELADVWNKDFGSETAEQGDGLFRAYMEQLSEFEGIKELAFSASGGGGIVSTNPQYFLFTDTMPENHRTFFESVISGSIQGIAVSDVAVVKKIEGETEAAVMLSVPLKRGGGETAPGGHAFALLDLKPINQALQRLSGGRDRLMLFALDSSAAFVSHPDLSFPGSHAGEAMNISHYSRLAAIIEQMTQGKSGSGHYIWPSMKGKAHDTRWTAAYAPVDFENIGWSVAVAFEDNELPMLGSLKLKYTVAAAVWLIVVAAFCYLLTFARLKHFDLDRRMRRLSDTAAVNDILRSVNTELTETKKRLEAREHELDSLNSERSAMAERLIEVQEKLFGSFKRPFREQREYIREIRKISKNLQKKPEGRFWKNRDDE